VKLKNVAQAELYREVKRRQYAADPRLKKEAMDPFQKRASRDFPLVREWLNGHMDEASGVESKPAVDNGQDPISSKSFYEQHMRVLIELPDPDAVVPVTAIAQVDLRRVPKEILEILIQPSRKHGQVLDGLRAGDKELIDAWMFPKRAALLVLQYNARYFSDNDLSFVTKRIASRLFLLTMQCARVKSICNGDTLLGRVVDDLAGRYEDFLNVVEIVEEMRNAESQEYVVTKDLDVRQWLSLAGSFYLLPSLEETIKLPDGSGRTVKKVDCYLGLLTEANSKSD
jgi:hypothetical protein